MKNRDQNSNSDFVFPSFLQLPCPMRWRTEYRVSPITYTTVHTSDTSKMDGFTVLKVQRFGISNTKSGWFLHQTKSNNLLQDILTEISSENNPCITVTKILELTDNEVSPSGAEFNTDVVHIVDTVNGTCKVKVNNDWIDSFTDCWILKYYVSVEAHICKREVAIPGVPRQHLYIQ